MKPNRKHDFFTTVGFALFAGLLVYGVAVHYDVRLRNALGLWLASCLIVTVVLSYINWVWPPEHKDD